MNQNLTDGSPRWFDVEKAVRFDESTTWDGNNNISDATGSQWDHEVLYRTASGAWVKHFSSQYQGHDESWTMVDEDDAFAWLLKNEHTEAVPESYIATQEI